MEEKDNIHVSNECIFLSQRGRVYRERVEQLEKQLIENALEHSNGNQLLAAKILGLNRNTLRTKIKKLNINVGEFKRL
ncbi:MAG: helix-turn-helix domain-containing protein [Candidatus Omnitrophota bacterium]